MLELAQGTLPQSASLEASRDNPPLVASNRRMRALHGVLLQIARADVPVLIEGESGVGKATLAKHIHALSAQAGSPFITVSCAGGDVPALSPGFSSREATGTLPDPFASADGGSVLLSRIDELYFELQTQLLRALECGELPGPPGQASRRFDARLLATTRCGLAQSVREHRFRADLYYRLSSYRIKIPPLRERRDEILPLAEHFLREHAKTESPQPEITPTLQSALIRYSWPGNIRELENAMRRVIIFGDPDLVARNLLRRRPLQGGK